MKNKIAKNLLAMAVAVATLAGSAMPAMAADVELQGDDQTAKSQSIEVSTGYISSVYCVSVPATLDLEYRVITNADGDDIRTNKGYFCDLTVGAAGKILDVQKLKMTLIDEPLVPGDNSGVWTSHIVGKTSGKSIVLNVVTAGNKNDAVFDSCSSDNLTDFSRFNTFFNSLEWDKNTIGTCDYDGTTLSNCVYTTKTITIGFDEKNIPIADEYAGTVTISFEIQ